MIGDPDVHVQAVFPIGRHGACSRCHISFVRAIGLESTAAHTRSNSRQGRTPPTKPLRLISGEVALERGGGGTFVVPVQINDAITLKFTLDSGASDVSIPADVVSTLIRTGTISRDDFIGARTYVLADGSTVPSAEFRIRSLRLGSMTLHNVVGSLAHDDAPLLLGQSFLSRLKTCRLIRKERVVRQGRRQ